MQYGAIVLGAGKGSRSGLEFNKVLYELDENGTIFDASLSCFEKDPNCVQIVAVCAKEEREEFENRFGKYENIEFVCGGKTRQDSVQNALEKIKTDYVFVHDGARPFIDQNLLERIKEGLRKNPAVICAVDVVDTIKELDENGFVIHTPRRSSLRSVQTPQAFETSVLQEAFEKSAGFQGTDDASLVEHAGNAKVLCVEGSPRNIKVTKPADIEQIDKAKAQRKN
jgi:2-C-methyl-D-erythritol 4-phosphate cytidylyltransferase